MGAVLFFINALIVNSFLAVIVPQIAFTYVLIYWYLPNYFYKRRNPLVSISVAAAILLIFYVVAVVFKHAPALYNRLSGKDSTALVFDALTRRVVLFNQLSSLPIIFGCALMIKLVKRWWQKQKETELLAKEKTKAELQLLKAQVHPHFLFNTLNNIYFFSLNGSPKAPEMIKKLSGLLNLFF